MTLRAFAAVAVFLALCLPAILGRSCSRRYLRMNSNHSMCIEPNSTCTIVKKGVTEKDKDLILRLHNQFRSKVATGKENIAGVMPPAADMLEMTWDQELAELSEKRADTCMFAHDCVKCRALEHFMVGQNIGIKWLRSTTTELRNDWNWFITELYDEVSRFDKNIVASFVGGADDVQLQYKHFTQIIWSKTWRIGCGWVLYRTRYFDSSYYVCNYGPAGNVEHVKVYKEGASCSECPKNSCCGETCNKFNITSSYSGLCKIIDEKLPPDGFGPHNPDAFFFCDFNNQTDCKMTPLEGKNWDFVKTIGGNWIHLVLNGGQSAVLNLTTAFRSPGCTFCFKVVLRAGAELDTLSHGFKGVVTFLSDKGMTIMLNLWKNNARQRFTNYNMEITLQADINLLASLAFSVPQGLSPQFFDIKEISATRDGCQRKS